MAKKVEVENVEITKVEEVKTDTPKEDIIVGVNPFKTVYSKMSADGQNGEKLEVIEREHDHRVLLVKSTEIVNGKVSVSIATTGVYIGVSLRDGVLRVN
jgi:hypothetical protein